MERRFEGKVVVITGAAGGIGKAAAERFGQEGANVVAVDLAGSALDEVVALVESAGSRAIAVPADVSKSSDVERYAKAARERFGGIDAFFNNAGIEGWVGPTTQYPEDIFDKVIAVNLKGVWLCMKYAIAQMEKQGGGVVINTASALSITVVPGASPYNASKHAVAGLTKTCAVEYGKKNIRINAICPGVIRTPLLEKHPNLPALEAQLIPLHPIGRLGEVDEVANVVLWLASDKASFVHGALVTVDGGWTAM